jgi:hypothetical protein
MAWHSDWVEDVREVLKYVVELTPDKSHRVT